MTDHMVGPVGSLIDEPAIAGALAAHRKTIAAIDVDAPDTDLIHDAIHGLRDLGRRLHEAGAGAPSQQGSVLQLSASNGGVPKDAVLAADVGRRGLLGDRQANRKHHGRPFQALCLWSA